MPVGIYERKEKDFPVITLENKTKSKYMNIFKTILRCRYCKKTFVQYKHLSNTSRYCSNECKYLYFNKFNIGIYGFTEEQRSNLGKNWGTKAAIINKKNHTGMFHDKKIQVAAGFASIYALRIRRRNIIFKNIHYDSYPERDVSVCLQYQYNYKPIEGKTLHIRIGKCEYDFLLEKLKLFIEYHEFWDNSSETVEQYYNRRRENLNENGYKEYKLIVIK